MVDYPEYDEQGIPYQPTHTGFNWNSCGQELSQWNDVWYLLSDPAVVQATNRPTRFYANFPNVFVACGMRETDDARVPRIQFLQFHSDCVLRSCYIRYCCNANIRGFRRRNSLL